MIIERVNSNFVTTYDGGGLHILDVRATELQPSLETDIYLCKQLSSLCSIV